MVAEEDQEHQELEVDPEHKDHKDPEELKVCLEKGSKLISYCTKALFNNDVLPVSLYGVSCKYHRCNNSKPGNVMATCVEYCRFDPMSGKP